MPCKILPVASSDELIIARMRDSPTESNEVSWLDDGNVRKKAISILSALFELSSSQGGSNQGDGPTYEPSIALMRCCYAVKQGITD